MPVLDVTLFATADSITKAKLHAICPKGYEEDPEIDTESMGMSCISRKFSNMHMNLI